MIVAYRPEMSIGLQRNERRQDAFYTILYSVAEADFVYLLRETGLTKGNLSSHVAKLEQAGYVEVEKTYQGKVPLTIYCLTAPGRAAFDAYRVHLQAIARALPATTDE